MCIAWGCQRGLLCLVKIVIGFGDGGDDLGVVTGMKGG